MRAVAVLGVAAALASASASAQSPSPPPPPVEGSPASPPTPPPPAAHWGPSFAALGGIAFQSTGSGLGPLSAAAFRGELGLDLWPVSGSPLLLGASAGLGFLTNAGTPRVNLDLEVGVATLDERVRTPWPRRGLSGFAFAGGVEAGGAWGWRTGLAVLLPFGGLLSFAPDSKTGRQLLDGWLSPLDSCGGTPATLLAVGIVVVVLAILIAGAILVTANELAFSVETLYPPGGPRLTTTSVMLGYAF